MAKKKTSKPEKQTPDLPLRSLEKESEQFDPDRNKQQFLAPLVETESSYLRRKSTGLDKGLFNSFTKASIQSINKKRECQKEQTHESTVTKSKIYIDQKSATNTEISNTPFTQLSQTSLKLTDLENENTADPKILQSAGSHTFENIKTIDQQSHESKSKRTNQRQRHFLNDKPNSRTSSYEHHQQCINQPPRHFLHQNEQSTRQFHHYTQIQQNGIVSGKQLSHTRNPSNQIHPNFHQLPHHGMVTLPYIHASSFLQHKGNRQQPPAMNSNTPSTSTVAEFIDLPPHCTQQLIVNQNVQHHPHFQSHIHQQVPFPVIPPQPQNLINQIPIQFPAIVTSHNIIPLNLHPPTHLHPTAILPMPQNPSLTNYQHHQQTSTICNQHFQQQQSNINIPYHWQIQTQKQQQQQQINQPAPKHCSQIFFPQQQKSNTILTPFYSQPLKPPTLPHQPFNFPSQQQAQSIAFKPNLNLQHLIPITIKENEDKDTSLTQNNTSINIPKETIKANEFDHDGPSSSSLHKSTISTTSVNTAVSSTTSNVSNNVTVTAATPITATTTTATCNNQGVNLYVKHLDDDVDDCALKKMFSRFGEVVSAKVMMEGQTSRGFGFVCFSKAEDAAKATREIRRKTEDINLKNLYVAPAQRKEERQAFFREKLKSFMGDMPQENETTLSLESSVRKSPSFSSMETKGEELKNLTPSSQQAEKENCASDLTKTMMTAAPVRSTLDVKRKVKRKEIFDLDNFCLEKLTIPLLQPTKVPIDFINNTNFVNQESQSEPIPEWFYEIDDEKGEKHRHDENCKNRDDGKQFKGYESKEIETPINFDQIKRIWPTFESPTKCHKFQTTIKKDKPSKDVENRDKESPHGKTLQGFSNQDIQTDRNNLTAWMVPTAWNCKLIAKEGAHAYRLSPTKSEESSSPDSLYECKKLVTDCIACCTDTDSAEEDERDTQIFNFPPQNGHNNNSNVYLSGSGQINDVEVPATVIEINNCVRDKNMGREIDSRIAGNKINTISYHNLMKELSKVKEKAKLKRKISSLSDKEFSLDHLPSKRRYALQELLTPSMVLR